VVKSFKQFVEDKSISIRDATGKKARVKKVTIRMADGSLRKMNPGKSGSSGGGGAEEE
jgi:hypothetical protein